MSAGFPCTQTFHILGRELLSEKLSEGDLHFDVYLLVIIVVTVGRSRGFFNAWNIRADRLAYLMCRYDFCHLGRSDVAQGFISQEGVSLWSWALIFIWTVGAWGFPFPLASLCLLERSFSKQGFCAGLLPHSLYMLGSLALLDLFSIYLHSLGDFYQACAVNKSVG